MIENFERVFVSFSGGQTSAYMALWIRDKYPDKDLRFVFANTGQEHEETYKFILRIQEYYGLDVTWVEAVIPKTGRKGYKVVNYDTACRDHSLFLQMIERFGIPTQGYAHCTRELKEEPMSKYIHTEWSMKSYCTAIGIRADEMDRVSSAYEKKNWWYPLAWNGITKEMINEFWDNQPFKLGIENYLGNCTWCWKKSYKKHLRILKEMPEVYQVPEMLEWLYGTNHLPQQKRYGQRQPFFRGHKWTTDLYGDLAELIRKDEEEGYNNSCKESCEPFKEV